ncbi:hypothetical protein NEPTK9_000965 [Candidatus Neptunochlamydia vexilliferae]|uniref:Competence protein CoiA nuclease-like domain-containing protein n=2 Tax=Candidatus Neptunichlamydia vexilliferae TaxID=1651774 RepID=A0ABS0B196_9BACT|nr:hypothetical protein [Candidatus Neptunochlamydia vexilliferae]
MSRPHLIIQKVLMRSLPGSVLEHPFPSIGRIADLVYFPKKLIFEVQCSPINLYEVRKRNEDYASLGFTVIWILHDRIFNKEILPPAEFYLRQKLAYYTSMNQFGQGFFYDQLDFLQGLKRVYKSPPHLLKSFLPRPFQAPFFFPKKLKQRRYYLIGDTADTLLKKNKGRWAQKLEKRFLPKKSFKARALVPLHYLLKKAADRPAVYIPLEGSIKR